MTFHKGSILRCLRWLRCGRDRAYDATSVDPERRQPELAHGPSAMRCDHSAR
jgi:hypothetical protein